MTILCGSHVHCFQRPACTSFQVNNACSQVSAGVTTGELAAWMDDAGAVGPDHLVLSVNVVLLDNFWSIVLCSLSCLLERGSAPAGDQAACCLSSFTCTEAWVCTNGPVL